MTGQGPQTAPALRVDGLDKTFGEGENAVHAVEDLSLAVEHGEVVGVLGPNGAGKTTAIKSMLGLVLPDAGTVEICGVDVHDDPPHAYRHVDAMLEGARNVYWRLTVRENLRYFAGLGGVEPDELTGRHDRLLNSLGLADVADTVVNELSRGMKQKVSLATTLSRDVDVVFLDEPTLGLDVESSIELRSELRRLAERENVTIVLCSHDMAVIEAVCDRIAILQDGRVIADDSMAALTDVLREERFSVTTEGPIEGAVLEEVEERFGAMPREIEGRAIGENDGGSLGGDGDGTLGGDGGEVTLDAAGIDAETAADLLDALRKAGYPLLEIETAEPTLEDVFLRLTDAGAGSVDLEGVAAARADTASSDRSQPATAEVSTDGDR